VASSEEQIFEALLRWMKKGDGGLRGRGLLSKVRFPLMEAKYLALRIYEAFPEDSLAWIEGLISEASRVKLIPAAERGALKLRHLGSKALVPRVCTGVQWGRYVNGGERRLDGHTADAVSALAECQGLVFSGSYGGCIRTWNRATLAAERVLVDGEAAVLCLREWEGLLISGHGDGRVRVWDVRTGQCDRVLEGHTGDVFAMVVCGARLLTASEDHTINVWRMGPQTQWQCERILLGHTNGVIALATWAGRAVSGSNDRTIRVWCPVTGTAEATLTDHTDSVAALVAHEDRLYRLGRLHLSCAV
jgi:WD40 repeat protein